MGLFRILSLRIKLIGKLISYWIQVRKGDAVLLNTPNHKNLGDHAIALAEIELLNTMGISFVELTAEDLERKIRIYSMLTPRNKVVLVNGGGFLGSIWKAEEKRFREILNRFSSQRVIVFPQTVTFDMDTEEDRAFFLESKKIYEAHRNLTIFVREEKSYHFMQSHMERVRVILVPDIVLSYKVCVPRNLNRNGILLCMRSDKEKKVSDAEIAEIVSCLKANYPGEPISFTDTVIEQKVYKNTRESEVNKKLQEFSSASLVVTDRLHGMVFSAISSTPCIALGNSNGKVKGVYQWLKSEPYITYVGNLDALEDVLVSMDLSAEYQYSYEQIEKEFSQLTNVLLKGVCR